VPELIAIAPALGLPEASLAAWALALARVLPTVVLLPAFGLGPVATPIRVVFGLVFAAALVPVIAPLEPTEPLSTALGRELVFGLSTALVASVGLWSAFMAGGLVDRVAFGEEPAGNMKLLLGVLASVAFLELGGAVDVAERLSAVPPGMGTDTLRLASTAVARGIGVAVLMAAPVLVATVLVDGVLALVVRGDPRGALQGLGETLRPVAIVFCLGLLLERVAELVVTLHP
jgi:type III secretory pathway component EscT